MLRLISITLWVCYVSCKDRLHFLDFDMKIMKFSECFGNNQSCRWLFCPMMNKHLINLLQDIIIITPDKTIDYDKTRPRGGGEGENSHWKIVLGHAALKTPIFRSLYISWKQTHHFKALLFQLQKASVLLLLLSFLKHFQARLIFAWFQHYLIPGPDYHRFYSAHLWSMLLFCIFPFMWIYIVWSPLPPPPPSPMYIYQQIDPVIC